MCFRFQRHSYLAAAASVAAAIFVAWPAFVAAVALQSPPAGPRASPPAGAASTQPPPPLIGDADIAGKTIPEAVAMLEKHYASEVRTPKVVIQVRTFSGQKVYVTGEVMRPGLINLPGTMTVFEAISEAGGVKPTGNNTLAILIRKGADGLPKGYRLALAKGGAPTAAASTILGPFDVVMIPESKISRVDRWVDQNVRQLIPVTLGANFSYVIARPAGGGTVVPIF
jgi:hypothetical protein